MKSSYSFILLIMLVALLLDGCATTRSSAAGVQDQPNVLHAKMFGFGSNKAEQDVMIDQPVVVRKLLELIRSMSPMPEDQVCTMQGGPRYELTFLEGQKVVLAATADASGCGTVELASNNVRLAGKNFWPLLNQAITDSAAQGQFDKLAVIHMLDFSQPPKSATLTATDKIRQLHEALKQLPEVQTEQKPQSGLPLEYKAAFIKNGQATLIQLSKETNQVYLYNTGNIVLSANQAFWQLVDSTFAGVTFENARPDNLSITIGPAKQDVNAGIEFIPSIDQAIMLKLYDELYQMPPVQPGLDCPAVETQRYELVFFWQSLELRHVYATPKECSTGVISLAGTATPMKWHANQDFWHTLQQAIKS